MMNFLLALCLLSADASTSDLPAALVAAGVSRSSVVATSTAHRVRGQSMPAFQFGQSLSWNLTGTATGTSTLTEGLVGSFLYAGSHGSCTQQTQLQAAGTFGGLAGVIGVNGNPEVGPLGLQFDLAGKALQQTITFGGSFGQTFSQSFGR
jgi:hypothetical protein